MRDDRLQKWALVAEVAGAVAVVITLGFLALEMRGNTNAVQAQTYQALMQELNDYRAMLVEPRHYEVQQKLDQVGWASLTLAEQQRLRIPSMIRWGIYESAYYANERGVLGEREWARFEVGICRSVDSQDAYWDPGGVTPMTELLTPDFVEYIQGSC